MQVADQQGNGLIGIEVVSTVTCTSCRSRFRQAQGVCDALVESGVLAIWNFAPMHLNTPEGILVQNENMAASLALLSKHHSERLGSKR